MIQKAGRFVVLRRLVLVATLLTVSGAVGPEAAAQPQLLRNVYDVPLADPGSQHVVLGRLNDGRAFLSAFDVEHGREPWITVGTVGGTFRLADLCPGTCDSLEASAVTGERAFFVVRRDGSNRRELWASDGTVAGTRRALDGLVSGFTGHRLQAVGERMFLSSLDDSALAGLWVSDGSPEGTRRLPYSAQPPSQPAGFLGAAGERAVFTAPSGLDGVYEVWGSDGTAAGTRRLHPDLQRPQRSAPVAGGVLLLRQVQAAEPQTDLWWTDGTPQGTSLRTSLPGYVASSEVTVDGERAFFTTYSGATGTTLWSSDGTAAGTVELRSSDGSLAALTAAGGRIFFVVGEDGCAHLEVSAAAAAGSKRLQTFCDRNLGRPVAFDDGVAFLSLSGGESVELWVSDGTEAGTRRAATLCEGSSCYGGAWIGGVFSPQGEERVFVVVSPHYAHDLGWHVYASDGTAAGTVRIAEALPSAVPPESFVAVPAGVVFSADDGVHGSEPWVSDGTPLGTGPFADLAPAVSDGDARPHGLIRYGDGFLFFARDGEGWGLWESDGTAAGTRRLHLLPRGRTDEVQKVARPLAIVGERLYFRYNDGGVFGGDSLMLADLGRGSLQDLGPLEERLGEEQDVVVMGDGRLRARVGTQLLVSDGTPEGTESFFGWRTYAVAGLDDGTVLVAATVRSEEGDEKHGVWRWNGSPGDAVPVYVAADGGLVPHEMVVAAGRAFFGVYRRFDNPAAGELWESDGTAAGTRLVKRIEEYPGVSPQAAVPQRLTASGSRVFFTVVLDRTQLWVSDGTAAGTVPRLTRTFVDGQELEVEVQEIVPFGEGALLVAEDALRGTELWKTGGSVTATPLLADLWPGADGSRPRAFTVAGDRAWFVADDGEGRHVWITDGSGVGTRIADGGSPPAQPLESPELLLLDDVLVYTASSLRSGEELWLLPRGGLQPPPGPEPTVPPAPRGLRLGRTPEGTRLVLSWEDRADDELYQVVEVKTPGDAAFHEIDRVPASQEYSNLTVLPLGVPHTFRVRAVNAAGPSPPSAEVSGIPEARRTDCAAGDDHLCLLAERFYAAVFWRDPRSGSDGRATGAGLAGSDRSGTFWFFRPANVELIVKVLDGTPVNRRYWVFAGGLTDLEYWLQVTDTADGTQQVYHHASGDLCGLADTTAFSSSAPSSASASHAGETSGGDELGLVGDRFRVEVEWKDQRSGDSGVGRAVPGSDNTGYFWFFNAANVELVVKVLDGRPVNGHWWVFHGGLTDVEYTLRVTDTVGNQVRTYHRPPANLCGGADTMAF